MNCIFTGEEIKELFEEYEEGQTPEALLVKDFDKVGNLLVRTTVDCLCPVAIWLLEANESNPAAV